MQLFNPTKKEIAFRYGGKEYVFQPKESKDLPEHLVNHATKTTNTPLILQTQMHEKEIEISDLDYKEMPWRRLVQMASARGVFKMGTKRPELEKIMEDYDKERGTLQKSSS